MTDFNTDFNNFTKSLDAKCRAETYFNTVYNSPDNVCDIELAIRSTYEKAFLEGRDFERNQANTNNSNFKQELASLLNRYYYDTSCETPDYILADYVESCLLALCVTMTKNINWHTDWKRSGEDND